MRLVVIDTDRWALIIRTHVSDVQDSDSAVRLLKASSEPFPYVQVAAADSDYAAHRVKGAICFDIEALKKIAYQISFWVLQQRWIDELKFGWVNRNRNLIKAFEGTTAFLYVASDLPLTKRLIWSA